MSGQEIDQVEERNVAGGEKQISAAPRQELLPVNSGSFLELVESGEPSAQ